MNWCVCAVRYVWSLIAWIPLVTFALRPTEYAGSASDAAAAAAAAIAATDHLGDRWFPCTFPASRPTFLPFWLLIVLFVVLDVPAKSQVALTHTHTHRQRYRDNLFRVESHYLICLDDNDDDGHCYFLPPTLNWIACIVFVVCRFNIVTRTSSFCIGWSLLLNSDLNPLGKVFQTWICLARALSPVCVRFITRLLLLLGRSLYWRM